jgi:Xaa-Pro aminopeptidase
LKPHPDVPRAVRWCPLLLAALVLLAHGVGAQLREREPNSEYASRRARLRAQADAPVVIFGYTGQENAGAAYVFNQENNFYYLTGHNEEGAALLLVPDSAASKGYSGPKEILYLRPRDPQFERWNGPRIGPQDADVHERTGFAEVRPFDKLRGNLVEISKPYQALYTILAPAQTPGYPHFQNWRDWLDDHVRNVQLRQILPKIEALREVKSPTELALLTRAIEVSMDAQFAAIQMMHPGLYEYQVAARMEEIHFAGGCEAEAYAPIVGAGFNSTVLHYDKLGAQIQDGDVVLMDVAGQFSGYAADITRTVPANGKFTPRQREIYEIVYGAQQAAIEAVKPGMTLGRGRNGLMQIAYDYINSHGTDLHGQRLGQYFIHGLGHTIGLEVHDAQLPGMVLEPGMVITVEPGIYLPEERLGVRIEDDVLVTASGFQLLTKRLPRNADEIEKLMAAARAQNHSQP